MGIKRKRLISAITTVVVMAGIFSSGYKSIVAKAATGQAVGGKYATNPNGNGKEANIKIDGNCSDWTEDMLIAQGLANDSPQKFKGDWENCVIDSYSLYAGWDDENLYVAWQNVNTSDICNGQGSALSDGKLADLHQFIAIDTGSGENLTGKCFDGKGIWGNDVTFETPVTHVFAMHADGTGTPGIFTSDGTGLTNYKANCADFDKSGIEFMPGDVCLPKQLKGIYQIPSNDSGVAMLYDDSVEAVDLLTKGTHDSKEDTFFEIKIPFKTLGITKEKFLKDGVGIMQMGLRGQSALDCLPHDKCMLDNVFGSYADQPSDSHEKDDNDIITVPLARAGGNGTGGNTDLGVVNISSFEASKNSPQYLGNSIKFTTKATGTNGVEYQYLVNNEIVQDYSSSNSFNWTPKNEGNYDITVKVRNGKGKSISKNMNYTIQKKGNNDKFTIDSFKTSVASPQKVGTSIKFTAKASEAAQYSFYVRDSNNKETIIRDYSGTNTATWKPTKEGKYTVYCKAMNLDGEEAIKKLTYIINVGTTLKINNVFTSVSSPQKLGSSIKFTINASGAKEYAIAVKDSSGESKTLKAYTSTNTAEWTPKKAGLYKVYCKAKNSSGEIVYKVVDFIIKEEENVKINSFKANLASPQSSGKSIVLTASAKGNTTLSYQFWQLDPNGNMKALNSYSTKSSITWTPTVKGDYILWVDVKDSEGNIISKILEYTINENITKIEESNSKLSFSGKWSTTSQKEASGLKIKYADTAGSKVSMNFTGTGIRLISTLGNNKGIAKVIIDGKSYSVDMYNKTIKNQAVAFEKTGLSSGKHTITVQYTGMKSGKSSGTAIVIDAFQIIGGTIK